MTTWTNSPSYRRRWMLCHAWSPSVSFVLRFLLRVYCIVSVLLNFVTIRSTQIAHDALASVCKTVRPLQSPVTTVDVRAITYLQSRYDKTIYIVDRKICLSQTDDSNNALFNMCAHCECIVSRVEGTNDTFTYGFIRMTRVVHTVYAIPHTLAEWNVLEERKSTVDAAWVMNV